jgi:hypothetical protein
MIREIKINTTASGNRRSGHLRRALSALSVAPEQ